MAGMVAVEERSTTTSLEQCRAALARGAVVFVCVPTPGADAERALRGVRELQADPRFPPSATVAFEPRDLAGPILLRELGVPGDGAAVVMLAPPGQVVGYFADAPTKEELLTSWLAAFGG